MLTELQDQETPDDDELEQRNYYFQIPAAFWTDGWAAMLSGRAVAMFLAVLSELSRKQANEKSVWFAPARAEAVVLDVDELGTVCNAHFIEVQLRTALQ